MPNNLQLYHKVKRQLCQWLPGERVTRLRNMALLIVGLRSSGAIHMALIVRKWPIAGKDPSLVNRLRRFLDNPRVVVADWYRPIAQEIVDAFAGQRVRLVIDSTKIGFDYRLLTIGVAYKKRTLPLVWSVRRGRKGHTSVEEQLQLLRQVGQLLPAHSEAWMIGDTEFQSVEVLRWLRRRGWHFIIRQQGKNAVRYAGQPWIKINALPLKEGQTRYVGWVRLTKKHDLGWFWLVLHWEKGEEEPWYLVSDVAGQRELIRTYKQRMWIEEMYGDLKGHGFDLETTHLDDADRLSRLVLAVCITFVWFITLGSWVVKRGYRHFVDVKSRRDKSYFRIGWDWIERCLRLGYPIPLKFKPYF